MPAVFTVTSTADTNTAGTLRNAVNLANTTPGADVINFNIPGGGLKVITVTGGTFSIDETVTIDGYTQPGSSPNTLAVGDNAVLNVELAGGGVGDAFRVRAPNSVIRGLSIASFSPTNATGIRIDTAGAGTAVVGNFIGSRASGTELAGMFRGVFVDNADDVRIGGPAPADRNVIGDNGYGVWVRDAARTVIQGNYIGTDRTGLAAIGNDTAGVYADGTSQNAQVGGPTPGAGNVISGNATGAGVRLNGAGVTGTTIAGNLIGLDAAGAGALANNTGVEIAAGVGNRVGGTTEGARNVVSGNTTDGVSIYAGAAGNLVQGNYIGTNAAGAAARGNGQFGVAVGTGATNNWVGGSEPVAGNVIGGNLTGVNVAGAGTTGTQVRGNRIGLDAFGTSPVQNLSGGVIVTGGAAGTTVRGNSVAGNGGLGIDLNNDGVTANDPGDADGGANGLQNYPLLSAVSPGTFGTVTGTLNSAPATTFILDFYATVGETRSGARYLGSKAVTTNGSGQATFSAALAAIATGEQITATATDPAGNTSEFSPAFRVNTPPVLVNVPSTVVVTEGGTVSFDADAGDPDLQSLQYTLFNARLGMTFNTVTGAFSWTPGEGQDGVTSFIVSVTDGTAFDQRQVTVTVLEVNQAPALAGVPATAVTVPGSPVTFTAAATDADTVNGLPNTLTYSLVGAPAGASIDPDTGAFSWTPTEADAPGDYTFKVRVADDGVPARSDTETVTVTVAPVALVNGRLLIGGTAGNDVLSVAPGRTTPDQLVVRSGKTVLGTFAAADVTAGIEAHGLGGADRITVAAAVTAPASLCGEAGNDALAGGGGRDLLSGGPGNDRLAGGGGDDLLLGGAGNDVLTDTLGQNVLIGGQGADRLTGGTGDDLMVGGSTRFDLDPTGLDLIRAEWSSADTYVNRVAHLSGTPGGLNSGRVLTAATVRDDGVKDTLIGKTGTDWYVTSTLDVVTGLVAAETTTTL